MRHTEVQNLAQELIKQIWPIPIGGAVGFVFLLVYSDWSGIGLVVALGTALLCSWAVTRPFSIPTNWAPNWRGVDHPTPEMQAQRRKILEAQNRSIMRYIAGTEILALGAVFVWSCLYRSFLPTNDTPISALVFGVFVFTAAVTAGSCWMGVYLQMRYRK